MSIVQRAGSRLTKLVRSRNSIVVEFTAAFLIIAAGSVSQAQLVHRYSFTADATDSVGGAAFDGSLVMNTLGNLAPTISGGQLNLNNPDFSGPSSLSNYLSLPAAILPASGSVTIEQWFTFTGSGYFTEAYSFSNNMNDTNVPDAFNGQYLMHTISYPDNGTGGGSHIAQALNGYMAETDAIETIGFGVNGLGYIDDGNTYMAATVIDDDAGTLSYYLYRSSDGAGGLEQTIPAIPLSSYDFTDAYLGRSAFGSDNATSGSVDEFRIYADAKTAAQIAIDARLGSNTLVPEPATLVLLIFAASGSCLGRIESPNNSSPLTYVNNRPF
jgi:hypothetical protein